MVEALLAEVATLDEAAVKERMMPAGCYTAPEFFAFEQKEVFARTWICVGRVEQVAEPGDCLATEVAGEPVLVVRGEDGAIRALSAICQHRGEIIPCPEKGKALRCPLHFWTYDFQGRLAGAPRMGDAEEVAAAAPDGAAAELRLELWHGFIFVNLDPTPRRSAPSLAKLEPLWAGYEATGLKALPPAMSDKPLPWNWKVQVENFTDAYHPEFVHIGTHDFAPSVMEGDGVRFTEMKPGDNAIVRIVPMRTPDGGMMSDGWGAEAAFPADRHAAGRAAPAHHLRHAAAQPHPDVRAGHGRLHADPAGRRRGDLRRLATASPTAAGCCRRARSTCPTSSTAARR